jgi:hypothetical protein
MAEPSLAQVFGAGATQSETTLSIQKSALAAVGLTPGASNKAEALLNAIVKLAAIHLTPANLDTNADQSIVIAAPTVSVDERFSLNFLVENYTIGFQRQLTSTSVSPDEM